jgi:hypothetical protein
MREESRALYSVVVAKPGGKRPLGRPGRRWEHNVKMYFLEVRWGSGQNQRFSNFFKVETTFISQNVLRTTLLLSALKANCLRFSTIVCDTQFTLV